MDPYERLLNKVEHAAGFNNPSKHGYGEARKELLDGIASLRAEVEWLKKTAWIACEGKIPVDDVQMLSDRAEKAERGRDEYLASGLEAADVAVKMQATIIKLTRERDEARGQADVALITAHRVCLGAEHDPAHGKIHGYCVVCGGSWPCDYADPNKLRNRAEKAESRVKALEAALNIDHEDVGRIMHESWTRAKRAQGFHGPGEYCDTAIELDRGQYSEYTTCRVVGDACPKYHADLIPWEKLPEKQKDINRHAFNAVLAELRRRAEGG